MSNLYEGKTSKQERFALRAFPGRLIVKEDPFEYKGRIIIPDKAQARPTTGYVIAVGDGVENIKVGQHVLYAQYSGTGIKLENQPHFRALAPEEILVEIIGDVALEDTIA